MAEQYENKSGNSGVVAFEINPDYIWIWFKSGKAYRYSKQSVSEYYLSILVELAKLGEGLNTFINKNKFVKNGFDRTR